MPLLDENTRKCPFCLREYHIRDDEWALSEDDPYIFYAPLCPQCGSGEVFCWHDEIYKVRRTEEREIPPAFEGAPPRTYTMEWVEPDHTHPRAQQMVLIEAVAKKLGVKRKQLDTTPETFTYTSPPRKPTRPEHRDWISNIVAPTDHLIRDKEVAEVEYNEAATIAFEEMQEKTQARELRAKEKAARKEEQAEKVVEPEIELTPKPVVDSPGKKVHNKPEGKGD